MTGVAQFQYTAVDPDGQQRSGKLTAADRARAQATLRAKNWFVVTLEEKASDRTAAASNGAPWSQWRKPRLNTKQLTLFSRQLSSLMQVSPLEESLRTISQQTEKDKVRGVLADVHAGVSEGQTLSDAMRRQPRSFPPIYRAMIAAGENSGALPRLAERLADHLERQADMRGKVISALAYPIVLSVVAIAVVTGLMVSVVPRVVEQFDNAARQLPLITRIVIAISEFLASWWWALLIGFALALLAGWRALQVPRLRYRFDAMMLRLPFIGKLIRDVHAASLARTLSTMIDARLPLLDGLILTSRTVRNSVLRESLDMIVERVRGGGSLSGALKAAGLFPPLLVYLAASGESAGQLGPMLERAAEYLEREFQAFTATAMAMLEPAIIIVMGGAVAIIILAILLPILQLQTLTGL